MTKKQATKVALSFIQQLKHSTPSAIAVVVIALLLSLTLSNGDDLPSTTQSNDKTGPFEVVRVIDGDTIVVEKNGQRETVRLIGIDTPEVDSPFTQTECFGPEASNFTQSILLNEAVLLEVDPTQDDRDIYDRLLRYVYLGNTNVNQLLIQEGYAYEYTFRTAYSLQQEFQQAQDAARLANVGLWAEDTCAGSTATVRIAFDEGLSTLTSEVPDGCIHFSQAPDNIGATTCVSGVVNNVYVSATDTTFINFCEDFQTCPFSSVVFVDDKSNFRNISDYEGKAVSITGKIDTYRGRPQITLREPAQLRLEQ